MVGKRLKAFAKEMALAFDEQKVYGVYDNYLLSITEEDSQNLRRLYVDVVFNESMLPQMAEIRDFLTESINQYSITAFDIKPTGVRVDTNTKASFDSFIDLFYNLLTLLKDNQIPGFTTCSSCGQPIEGDPEIVAIGSYVHSCDAACANNLVDAYKKANPEPASAGFEPRDKTQPRRIFAGILGAIFGTIFGLLIWVAAHYFGLGLYAVFAGVLVGLLAHAGYRVFGARRSGARFAVCTIVPALGVVAAEFAAFCVTIGRNWSQEGVVYTLSDLIKTVFQSITTAGDTQTVFLRESLMGILLVLVVAVLFTLFKPKKPKEQESAISDDPNKITILEY